MPFCIFIVNGSKVKEPLRGAEEPHVAPELQISDPWIKLNLNLKYFENAGTHTCCRLVDNMYTACSSTSVSLSELFTRGSTNQIHIYTISVVSVQYMEPC